MFASLVLSLDSFAGRELCAAGADRDRSGATSSRAVPQPADPIPPVALREADAAQVGEHPTGKRRVSRSDAADQFRDDESRVDGICRDHPVARRGIEFLKDSVRPDGSWPIDTNLATWVTTLSVNALLPESLP